MPDWKQEISEHLADLRIEPAREPAIVEELRRLSKSGMRNCSNQAAASRTRARKSSRS